MVTRRNRADTEAATSRQGLQDLLERQNLELEELRDRVQHLENGGSEFLSAASHAVMNPLTIIQSYLEIVLSDLQGGLSEQQTSFITTAHGAALTMRRMIDGLVELAAFEVGAAELEYVDVSVGDVVADVCRMFEPAADRNGLELSVDISPGIPDVRTDAGRLRNAIDAVVSNAVRLTPRGGSVRVAVSQRDGEVVVDVSDTGAGIPEDKLEHVFQPFVRLSRSHGEPLGGAGLGLSVARRQMEALGGRIDVSSTVNRGSTFSLVVPAPTGRR